MPHHKDATLSKQTVHFLNHLKLAQRSLKKLSCWRMVETYYTVTLSLPFAHIYYVMKSKNQLHQGKYCYFRHVADTSPELISCHPGLRLKIEDKKTQAVLIDEIIDSDLINIVLMLNVLGLQTSESCQRDDLEGSFYLSFAFEQNRMKYYELLHPLLDTLCTPAVWNRNIHYADATFALCSVDLLTAEDDWYDTFPEELKPREANSSFISLELPDAIRDALTVDLSGLVATRLTARAVIDLSCALPQPLWHQRTKGHIGRMRSQLFKENSPKDDHKRSARKAHKRWKQRVMSSVGPSPLGGGSD